MSEALNHGMTFLVTISEVDDPEMFKICLEYWHQFANELYADDTQLSAGLGRGGPLALGLGGGLGGAMARKSLYRSDLLTRLRMVMISNMAKPEEVVVVEDEVRKHPSRPLFSLPLCFLFFFFFFSQLYRHRAIAPLLPSHSRWLMAWFESVSVACVAPQNGDIVREQQKDTEVIAQYKTMREALVFLTHLNYEVARGVRGGQVLGLRRFEFFTQLYRFPQASR